jgi:hypothetical protein
LDFSPCVSGLRWWQIRCVHSQRSVPFQAGDMNQEFRLHEKGLTCKDRDNWQIQTEYQPQIIG